METNYNFEALYHLLQTNQLSALRDELAEMNVVDIADFLQELSNEGMAIAFRILPKDISADVFSYLDPDRQSHIVGTITDNELSSLLDMRTKYLTTRSISWRRFPQTLSHACLPIPIRKHAS